MKKNKGFTLIEMLTVIVILAVIALIAIPLVLKYIDKTRKESAEISAIVYKEEVERYLVLSQLDKTKVQLELGVTYQLSEMPYEVASTIDVNKIIINNLIDIKGDKPTSGYLILKDLNTIETMEMVINDINVICNSESCSTNGYISTVINEKLNNNGLVGLVSNTNLINDTIQEFEVNGIKYSAHVYNYEGGQVWDEDKIFGNENDVSNGTEYAKNMVIVKVNGNLTINEGVTVGPYYNEYGGPKGFLLFVSGTLTNKGTIDNSHGAYALGENVYLWQKATGIYEYVPALGSAGGAAVFLNYDGSLSGKKGENGMGRGTAGGGSGSAFSSGDQTPRGTSGAGGVGTSYSGGAGGGGSNHNSYGTYTYAGSGSSVGGAGGAGYGYRANSSWYTRRAGGGAGNPGGKSAENGLGNTTVASGSNGTGGLLIMYAKNLHNYGSITANGSSGGVIAESAGGSSGGGSINIFYKDDCTSSGIIQASGGMAIETSVAGYTGGAGGDGSVNISSILKGEELATITEYDYDYTGSEQVFIAPASGTYKLETWGAQGGVYAYKGTISGGYGGYSSGFVKLSKGEKIYINVGGKGSITKLRNTMVNGGYNGGGLGYSYEGDDRGAGSGGGATHISFESGVLSSLSNKKDKVIMVSGGGAGAAQCCDGYNKITGSGGGFIGGTGIYVNVSLSGGNQIEGSSGGLFGQGGNCATTDCSGGGGGYYGGAAISGGGGFGSGGSGYIGNTKLTNKTMYCYNCTESTDVNTRTITTTNVSEKPISNFAKKGNGYARITYIGVKNSESILSNIKNSKLENESYGGILVNEELYRTHVYSYSGNQEWSEDMIFGDENDIATDTEYAKNTIVVKVDGDLTIDEGVTVTTVNSNYGGPKGLILYVTGNLINNGTISMTAKGAKAPGQNIYLLKNSNASYEYVPAIGAVGGAYRTGKGGISTAYHGYTPTAATDRKTGGGGGGGMIANSKTTTSGSGGTGTSYSGGAGGGGAYYGATAGAGSSIGGAGGNGAANSQYKYGSGGGAGNPIGKCVSNCSAATNGTGGLLVIYADNFTNNGSITSNGSKGGNAYRAGGGGSGGGSINIFYNTLTEKGTITANGGSYGVGTRSSSERSNGGSGGAGTVTLGSIATGNFVLQE